MPGASGPVFSASAGYAYLSLDSPDAPSRRRVGLSGAEADGFADFSPRWGVMLDASYAHAGDVLGTGHGGNVFSLMAGPMFHPLEIGKTRIFAHTLVGASLVNSAVPVRGTYYLGGTLTRFSYAMGGGIERPLGGRFAFRVGADYFRTTFANATAAMQFQNNLRVVTAVNYRFGKL